MNEPLVSVIVPIYNAQEYLRECIDSILCNTYRNLEVILVNDGSKDDSAMICEEYSSKDARIVFLTQSNRGISATRNKAISCARGKYIAFVDADDVVSPLFYEVCVQIMETQNVDFIGCEHSSKQENLLLSRENMRQGVRILETRGEILSVLTQAPATKAFTWTFCMVWNKFYRKEKIVELFDTNSAVTEDLIFNWAYALGCRNMALVPNCLYYWRENQQSMTRKANKEKKSEKACRNAVSDAKAWIAIANNGLSLPAELQHHLQFQSAYYSHQALWRIAMGRHEREFSEFIPEARRTIKKHWYAVAASTDCDARIRAMCVCCRFVFPLWKAAARILG